MTENLLDVKQVQEALHISERTVFRLIKEKELTGFKVGRAWRFTEEDINAFIDRQRKKAALDDDTAKRETVRKEQEG